MADLEKLTDLGEIKEEIHKLEQSIARVIDNLEDRTAHQVRIDRIHVNRGAVPIPDVPHIIVKIDSSIT